MLPKLVGQWVTFVHKGQPQIEVMKWAAELTVRLQEVGICRNL